MQRLNIVVGPYQVNASLLWREPQSVWLIDPGASGAKLLAALDERDLRLGLIVLTHGHFDHISAVNDILERHPVPVYLHEDDVAMAFSPLNAMPPYPATQRPGSLVSHLSDDEFLIHGGLSARIIHTPGHTPGSWCLHFEDQGLLIAGDTLFAGSVGRTDFPGGSREDQQVSLARLKLLPDETRVVCGHGPATSIGFEKAHNPYLQA